VPELAGPTDGPRSIEANISAGGAPFGDLGGIAVNPKTDTIYATRILADVVLVINGRTNTTEASIPVGAAFGGAAGPKTDTAYVSGVDTVSVIAPCRK
jgi:DNA-binding beta-propeller fold protein YncE